MPSLATPLATTPLAKDVTVGVGVAVGVAVSDALSEGLELPAGDAATEAEHAEVKISAPTIPAAAMILRGLTRPFFGWESSILHEDKTE